MSMCERSHPRYSKNSSSHAETFNTHVYICHSTNGMASVNQDDFIHKLGKTIFSE